jgi:hypothetical protein
MRIMQVKMARKPASSMKISGMARRIATWSPASIAAGIRSPSAKVTKCDHANTLRARTSESARPRLLTAIAHAFGFWAWVSMANLGLSDDTAAALILDIRGVVNSLGPS